MRLNKYRIITKNLILLTHLIIISLLVIIYLQLRNIRLDNTVIKGELQTLYLQNKLQLSKDNYYYSNKQISNKLYCTKQYCTKQYCTGNNTKQKKIDI